MKGAMRVLMGGQVQAEYRARLKAERDGVVAPGGPGGKKQVRRPSRPLRQGLDQLTLALARW